ncbi:MAG TPA: MFS transporter [Opitutales bacterium]|nr:MFS transporter [Opitutales bacterium]
MDTPNQQNWQRGFWSLMGTQCQNAFSDNALKYLVIWTAILDLPASMSEVDRNAAMDSKATLAGIIFAVPFILLSMFGGWLADRLSKQRVMSFLKVAEIGIMLTATAGLFWHLLPLQLAAIFMMSCHSAIFGPSKYGILPEILPLEKLSWGNGLLELLTFGGIILGQYAGSSLAQYIRGPIYVSGLLLAGLAFCGWLLSRQITHVPAADPKCPPRFNPLSDLWRQMRVMRKDRDLWRANWGNTGFWFVAALVQLNLIIHGTQILHLNPQQNSLMNAALLIGIGVGSATAGFASRGRIQFGLVPLGAAGLFLSSIPMGFEGLSTTWFCVCLVSVGFMAGIFIVPIAAVLQHRPSPETKGAIQGAASLLSWIGILAATGVQWLLNNALKVSSGHIFWFCGLSALATGIYAVATRREAIRQLFESFRQPPVANH